MPGARIRIAVRIASGVKQSLIMSGYGPHPLKPTLLTFVSWQY
jgi:hypothetical protein